MAVYRRINFIYRYFLFAVYYFALFMYALIYSTARLSVSCFLEWFAYLSFSFRRNNCRWLSSGLLSCIFSLGILPHTSIKRKIKIRQRRFNIQAGIGCRAVCNNSISYCRNNRYQEPDALCK